MNLFSKATKQIGKQMTDPMNILSGINFGNDNHLNDIKNAIVSNPVEYINDLNKFSVSDVANQNCDEKDIVLYLALKDYYHLNLLYH